jgi:hypothetical protein
MEMIGLPAFFMVGNEPNPAVRDAFRIWQTSAIVRSAFNDWRIRAKVQEMDEMAKVGSRDAVLLKKFGFASGPTLELADAESLVVAHERLAAATLPDDLRESAQEMQKNIKGFIARVKDKKARVVAHDVELWEAAYAIAKHTIANNDVPPPSGASSSLLKAESIMERWVLLISFAMVAVTVALSATLTNKSP